MAVSGDLGSTPYGKLVVTTKVVICTLQPHQLFLSSSMVEQHTVTVLVGGSSPPFGANLEGSVKVTKRA